MKAMLYAAFAVLAALLASPPSAQAQGLNDEHEGVIQRPDLGAVVREAIHAGAPGATLVHLDVTTITPPSAAGEPGGMWASAYNAEVLRITWSTVLGAYGGAGVICAWSPGRGEPVAEARARAERAAISELLYGGPQTGPGLIPWLREYDHATP